MLVRLFRGRSGNEFVEASIVIPLIVAITIILLKLFVFYFDILTTSSGMHEELLKTIESPHSKSIIDDIGIRNSSKTVYMMRSSLKVTPRKDINIRFYEFNEDDLVRGRSICSQD